MRGMASSMTVRDTHRSRLYGAEDQVGRMLDRASKSAYGAGATVEFHGSRLTLPVERRFADVASVQRYVDSVLAMGPVRKRWGVVPALTVRERTGQRAAHYEPPGVIAIPARERWALRELVVCHEIAHHITEHSTPSRDRARHGPPFPDVYASLVGMAIGPEVELLLRSAMSESGVTVGDAAGDAVRVGNAG